MTNNKQNIKIITTKVDGFKLLYIQGKPPRLEAQISFDKDDISQKLIFTLMGIAHLHGFACSAPQFYETNDSEMTFLIGTILPNRLWHKKHTKRLCVCLRDISIFFDDFVRQLDFSMVDISMLAGIDFEQFNCTEIAAVRDQHYNGCWVEFHNNMISEGRKEEAEVITKCMAFEDSNDKDLGFVGHKLDTMLYTLETAYQPSEETN